MNTKTNFSNFNQSRVNQTYDNSEEIKTEFKSSPIESTGIAVDHDMLRNSAKKRQQQPLIQKIVQKITHNTKPFREIIINAESLEVRVAQLVDGIIERFEIERVGEERIINSIFKGKVQNLEPGLKAAFVDIGLPKNAFLHYWDMLASASENIKDPSIEVVRDTRTLEQKKNKKRISLKSIPLLYPIGSEVIIQVTKGQIGSKGPRSTTSISLPGRYLVLMPYSGQCGISRKIENSKERQRLRKIINSLTIPQGMGIIIRTAGEGKKTRYFVRDLYILLQTWEKILKKMRMSDSLCLLHQEPDLIERTMRDFLTGEIDRILVDDENTYKRLQEGVGRISPRLRSKINHVKESIPIFERFNIERQVEQTYQKKITLPSGGEIVIDETEALIAIDVNTGSHKLKKNDKSNYILQVNIEAAIEITRQIILRNIGGLIIVDFIDMKQRRDCNTLLKIMRREMAKDKARSHILPVSQLGLMQMTRQRQEESVARCIYTSCHYCHGHGVVKSARTMSVEIQRRLVSVIRKIRVQDKTDKALELLILCNPVALERLRSEDQIHLIELEKLYNVKLTFRANEQFHIENFKILNAEDKQEYK
jgi:ribonuclease G